MCSVRQQFVSEALGSAVLLAAIVGSGIMGERLSGGNQGLALLCNSIATGSILFVLITMLEPHSGAHFNPAITAAMVIRGELKARVGVVFVLAQVLGAYAGVLIAHCMFSLPLLQLSNTVRSGFAQGFSEFVATTGLVAVVLLTRHARKQAVAKSVALYVLAAYWFTASTSFANPAVTFARAFSETFTGIRLGDVPMFVFAQFSGAVLGVLVANGLFGKTQASESLS